MNLYYIFASNNKMPFCKHLDKVNKDTVLDICNICKTWCSETCMKAFREQASVNEIPGHKWLSEQMGSVWN